MPAWGSDLVAAGISVAAYSIFFSKPPIAESVFASLECELIDCPRWLTHTEARMAVFEYIERCDIRDAATQRSVTPAAMRSAALLGSPACGLGYLQHVQFGSPTRLTGRRRKT
jgi:hypothetical protein